MIAGTRGGGFRRPGESVDFGNEEDVLGDAEAGADDELDGDDIAVEEEADASLEADEDDEGQAVHNDRVAKTIREKAIHFMEEQKQVYLDPHEEKIALQIFPRVSLIIYNISKYLSIKF